MGFHGVAEHGAGVAGGGLRGAHLVLAWPECSATKAWARDIGVPQCVPQGLPGRRTLGDAVGQCECVECAVECRQKLLLPSSRGCVVMSAWSGARLSSTRMERLPRTSYLPRHAGRGQNKRRVRRREARGGQFRTHTRPCAANALPTPP